ncbi:hypothetical protein GGR52DRAFT_25246 [Hypoxylon sp. FL1284]|nr:hypothetical protein GGR52DRAFT_25246 [Hypoxylon sp. FL1284]
MVTVAMHFRATIDSYADHLAVGLANIFMVFFFFFCLFSGRMPTAARPMYEGIGAGQAMSPPDYTTTVTFVFCRTGNSLKHGSSQLLVYRKGSSTVAVQMGRAKTCRYQSAFHPALGQDKPDNRPLKWSDWLS